MTDRRAEQRMDETPRRTPLRVRLDTLAAGAVAVVVAVLAGCQEPPRPPEEPEAAPSVADAVRAAAWSTDGRTLLVSWYRRDRHRLYVLFAPSGSTPPEPSRGIPVMEDEALGGAWAPDRLWVAFETSRDGNDEVYRVRPDGMGPENLTHDPGDDGSPAFSPDSRRIAFTSTRGAGPRAIWIMNADGRNARPLGAQMPEGEQRWPAWSRDGRRIAFAAFTGGANRVFVAAADGTSAAEAGRGTRPAWSHDGGRLYYDRGDSIFERPADGSGDEAFVVQGTSASPSPDGAWLAFVRGDETVAALYLLDLASGSETQITP